MIELIAYYFLWAVIMVPMFTLYAKALYMAAHLPALMKILVGFTSFLLFASFCAFPLVYGIIINESWRLAINSNGLFALLFCASYVGSMLPGFIYFRRKHLNRLIELGYFRNSNQVP